VAAYDARLPEGDAGLIVEREAGAKPRHEASGPVSLIDSARSAVSGNPAAKALNPDPLAAVTSKALALRLLARYPS
jgi:hypothetical protein